MVKAINTLSGNIVDVSEKTLNHPILGVNLMPVDDGQKPYIAEMYEPKTVDEFTAIPRGRRRNKTQTEEVETVEESAVELLEETEDE